MCRPGSDSTFLITVIIHRLSLVTWVTWQTVKTNCLVRRFSSPALTGDTVVSGFWGRWWEWGEAEMWGSQRKALLPWGAPRPLEREWLVGKEAEGPDSLTGTSILQWGVWSQAAVPSSGGLEQTDELPGLRDDKEHLSSTQHALQLRTTPATAAQKSHRGGGAENPPQRPAVWEPCCLSGTQTHPWWRGAEETPACQRGGLCLISATGCETKTSFGKRGSLSFCTSESTGLGLRLRRPAPTASVTIYGVRLSLSTWVLSCTVHWVGKEKPSLLPRPHSLQGHSGHGSIHRTLQSSDDTRGLQPTSAGAPAEVGGNTSSCGLRPGRLPSPFKLSFNLILE